MTSERVVGFAPRLTLIDGNRIAAVGATVTRPAGVAVTDGVGGTLMPGLIEAHAHLSFPDLFSNDITRLPVEEHMLITVRNAKTMLDSGYTSGFSAASAKTRLDVVLKREIEAGRVPGPRTLANGPEITVTGGLGDTNVLHLPYDETPTFCWIANGPDEIRRVARTLAREGVDLLKLNISGDGGTSSAGADVTVMTDEEVEAAMEIARPRNLRVAGHCRSAGSVMMALRHGVEVIYHANYADEEALDALEAARDRIFVAPAIARIPRTRTVACASAGSVSCPAATTASPRARTANMRRTSSCSSTSSGSRRWRPSSPRRSTVARSWASRGNSAS